MSALLGKFRILGQSKREKKQAQMSAFLTSFSDIHQKSRQLQVANFNLFSLLQLSKNETTQTTVLGWLLDAEGSHGQGPLFLEQLVKLCDDCIPPEHFSQPYRVLCAAIAPQLRLDLILYRPGEFLVAIDNNLLGREGINQADLEIIEMRRLGSAQRIPKERQIAIFLTPEGRAPFSGDASHWHLLSYPQLAAALDQVVPQLNDLKLKHILVDWIEVASRV
ncbi:PD-(D/E)XK nuclease family protein [Laspinema olomoucense]|uniref:PD-(D/E)XK nuclease family protein n=2 Tax=Laspinema olomoucense TaxID=3231600 RepID=UPI0021BB0D93|nr:PD-(D/E)XK nuclease family protein [Laspinema sp. D3c]